MAAAKNDCGHITTSAKYIPNSDIETLGRVFKMLFEPIQNGEKLNEAQEIQVSFVVSSADSAIAFRSLKEVFDLVSQSVVTAMPGIESRADYVNLFNRSQSG